MEVKNRILLGGILTTFLTILRVNGRALPDFYTVLYIDSKNSQSKFYAQADEDLDAWHKFGLRSFYGPWSVIARKPSGDLISYTDYGSTVPSDFRSISTRDEDHSSEEPSNPHSLKVLPTDFKNLSASSLLDLSPESVKNDPDEEERARENLGLDDVDKTNKRDTLELIGIVGVIENDETTIMPAIQGASEHR